MAWILALCIGWLAQVSQAVEIQAEIELQGAVEESFDREVCFTATDVDGTVLDTWTKSVTFTEGSGEANLLEAPDDLAYLSAKTDWTLRRRVACEPKDGQTAVAFTETEGAELRGGDLNGDNQVDMQDFSIFRYHWYSENSDADITGSGTTDMKDYGVLKTNWYAVGDKK